MRRQRSQKVGSGELWGTRANTAGPLRRRNLLALSLTEVEARGDLGSRLRRHGRAHSTEVSVGYRTRKLYEERRPAANDCETFRKFLTNTNY